MSAGEVDPAEVCSPANYGGSGEGAESGDYADEEGEEEDGHALLLMESG